MILQEIDSLIEPSSSLQSKFMASGSEFSSPSQTRIHSYIRFNCKATCRAVRLASWRLCCFVCERQGWIASHTPSADVTLCLQSRWVGRVVPQQQPCKQERVQVQLGVHVSHPSSTLPGASAAQGHFSHTRVGHTGIFAVSGGVLGVDASRSSSGHA